MAVDILKRVSGRFWQNQKSQTDFKFNYRTTYLKLLVYFFFNVSQEFSITLYILVRTMHTLDLTVQVLHKALQLVNLLLLDANGFLKAINLLFVLLDLL
jgi:hypothetical protein